MSGASFLLRGLRDVGDLTGPRAILVEDGRVGALDGDAEASAGSARVVNAAGLVAAPGFVELQLNGVAGHDFTTEPASMWRVGSSLAHYGVTAFLPTIVTSPRGTVEAALHAWRTGSPLSGAVPLGLHVEGPYLSPARRGAHDPALVREPDLDELDRWLSGAGIRVLTLAPELTGALEAMARLASAGVVASIGHTDADAATARRAVDAGATYATHLFNAMPPLGHRAPGAAGALLADDRVTLGVIADGHHLDPLILELVARAAGRRVSLVSDAIAALGLPDGTHRLADSTVEVRDGTARLPDGTLAGSVVGLDACVRAYADVIGSQRAAVDAVTVVPARILRMEDRIGAIEVGRSADLVLLDADLHVRMTIVGGIVAFSEEHSG